MPSYTVTVFTGSRKGAGTDAIVTITIKGNVDHRGKYKSIN